MHPERLSRLIGKLISEQNLIDDIIVDGNETYFKFQGHAFSMIRRADEDVSLYIYPTWKGSASELSAAFTFGSPDDSPDMASYKATEYPELRRQFEILYKSVRNKASGVDKVFDDLLGPEPSF